jgi:hypothetical protein
VDNAPGNSLCGWGCATTRFDILVGSVYAVTDWVASVELGKHDVFINSTLSGWSNNDVGLAWLEQVFDRCTRQKARRGRDY